MIRPLVHALLALLAAGAGTAALAGTPVPSRDLAGLQDPPGLQRYKDAVLFYRDDAEYDELNLPSAPTRYGRTADDSVDLMVLRPRGHLAAKGQRTRLMYAAPAGRSHLEVLRNYQTQLGGAGYQTLFECSADGCGDGVDTYVSDSARHFANFVFPHMLWKTTESSPQGCAAAIRIKGVRYALLKNERSGEVIALFLHSPDIGSVYCDEADWQARSIVTIAYVKPKGIEQNMVQLGADEMSKAIAQTGRVALYGILFDTAKAEIKPASKAALDEIAKLMKADASLKLHVVGHTDDQGGLQANFELSRRRAEAVKTTLTTQYGIAAARLTANGVASLAPVASNAGDEGRARNRRVELVPF